MGNAVGTFHEDEVKHLSRAHRKELKRQALKHLKTSKEIRALITSKPRLFTKIDEVNKVMRKKLNPVRERMTKG
jgi:hypothetical protein